MTTVEQKASSDLDARYGRTRGRLSRRSLVVIAVAAGFVVVFVAWLVWGGLLAPAAQIETDDVGYTVVDDGLVNIRFQLAVAPGTKTKCALEGLDKGFSVIGWKIIDVPASAQRVRILAEDLATSERAVTGLIYRCWPA